MEAWERREAWGSREHITFSRQTSNSETDGEGRPREYTPPGTLERINTADRLYSEASAGTAQPHGLPPSALLKAAREGRPLSPEELRAFRHWMDVNPQGRLTGSTHGDESLIFEAMKRVAWRPSYARVIRICSSHLITLEPKSRRVTNRWELIQIKSMSQDGATLSIVLPPGFLRWRTTLELQLTSADDASRLLKRIDDWRSQDVVDS
mgnify:CR=1 FL=1|tara:strand:+ start:107 stop:730 length:624 start_codon:yes stop_codon:yes gene_type:complete